MTSRRTLITAAAGVAVIAIAVVVWLLRGRPPNEQIVRLTIRHAATPEKNEKDIALALEKELGGVPRLVSQRIAIDRFGVVADCRFEPRNQAQRRENEDAVANAHERLVRIEEAPSDEPAIWIFGSTDLTKELRGIPDISVETCGADPGERVRVKVDAAKLKARGADIVEVELAIGPDTMMRPIPNSEPPDPNELGKRPIHEDVRLSDVATLAREKRPLSCSAFTSDGKATIAHTIHPLPGLTPDARARIDGIARDANATIVHEVDAVEVRFVLAPTATYESQRRTAADYAVRGKVVSGLDVVGTRVAVDGSGSVVVRKPAKIEALRALINENAGVAWGGIRGAHRIVVVIHGDDRKTLEKRAREVSKRVGTIDGVGAPVMLAANEATRVVFEVDEKEAQLHDVPPPALHIIADSLQGEGSIDAPVALEAQPLDQLTIAGGAPLSAYVHQREKVVSIRLLRVDQKPALELAWETNDANAEARVRQALVDSADLSVRVLPPF